MLPASFHIRTFLRLCPLLILGVGMPVMAQSTDSTVVPVPPSPPSACDEITAESFLDIGNVRAKIMNNGGLFWKGGANTYEVPKGGGVNAIFAANLWLGGMVDNDLRVAASTYGPWEFWPGPIQAGDLTSEECAAYDRIWKVNFNDLRADGLFADERLSEWPVSLGAPFVDVDGDGAYRPAEGDRPEILGDQQLWWIMNDAGGEHLLSNSEPLGVEVRATAFAFDVAGAVGNSTFYRYRIRNTTSHPITEAFASMWSDTDLGAPFDDYIGSDSTFGMGYAYNADNNDDNQYGAAPPAIGFTVLKRPVSSLDDPDECRYPDTNEVGFTNVMHYHGGGGVSGAPADRTHFYNFMQSRWRDGVPLRMGSSGRDAPGIPMQFVYPGDPVTASFWSERNNDGSGLQSAPADRRFMSSLGPFCMAPGEEVELVIAIVWSRGSSNLDSVRQLREDVAYIQSIRDVLLTPRALPGRDADEQGAQPELPFAASVYPNPVGGAGGAGGSVTVRLSTPETLEVRVDVFNALGQRVHEVATPGIVAAGDYSWTLPTDDWAPGVYLVQIQAGYAVTTQRLVVVAR